MDAESKTISPPHEAFYIQSMLLSANSAVRSLEMINAKLSVVHENSPDDPVAAIPVVTFLTELQNLILHAASLSRYLWPARNDHAWRGKQIRQSLKISDNSPLKSRDLRNAIEHFDERLDKYLDNELFGLVFPHYIGYTSDNFGGVAPHFLRAYWIDTRTFELLGEKHKILLISQELIKIHKN